MDKRQANSFNFSLFVILLISFSGILSNCGPSAEPVPDAEKAGYVSDDVQTGYIASSDPCPKEFNDKISIRCHSIPDNTTCTADSFAITKLSGSLNTIIPGAVGQSASIPQDGSTIDVVVQYTCVTKESFWHEFEVVLYKDGLEIATEPVEVQLFYSE